MTRVYGVSHSEGVDYVPTKAEALRLAREIRKVEGDTFVGVDVNVVTTRLSRGELYCALLNGEGWSASHEEVPL
jgi:hypothetical protein